MGKNIRESIGRAAKVLKDLGAREVYVFGSASSGELAEGSDVDLAVSGLPAEVYFRAIGLASTAMGIDVDIVDLDEDSPFTRYLQEEGELQRVA